MIFKNSKIFSFVRLFNRGFRRYKRQILLLGILGFVGGLLEGIGINAVIPLFSFISGGEGAGNDFISKAIQRFFDFLNISFNLRYLLIFIALLFVLRAIALFWCNYIRAKIAASYEEQTRAEIFSLTLKADWPYLLNQKLGHLETLLVTNVQSSGLLLQYLGNSITTFFGLLMYALVAVNISFSITAITAALGVLLLFFFRPLAYKAKAISRQKEIFNKEVSHYINENILGVKTVKAAMVNVPVVKAAARYFSKLKDLVLKVSLLRIFSDSLVQPIGMIFICFVFAISYKTPDFSFAALAAVIYLIQRMFLYVQQLLSNMHTVSESTPYLRALLDYRDEVAKNIEADNGREPFVFNKELKFKDVFFSYGNNKQVLNSLNLSIKKGEMVGLVGPSGAGKTTIVDLILRLFKPEQGKILLDGQEIEKIKIQDWRKNIGYVSQDMFLKNDSIANNIRFYDETIIEADVEEAAKMANIYDFVQSCPLKFETIIGERGVLLSAGQRQRIIIARILARKPRLLIFDEATSALDNESETQIQKVIDNLKNKVTVLAVAHRLSTIINSDRILVLGESRIIEEGAPRKLLADKNSYFYKVYNVKNSE